MPSMSGTAPRRSIDTISRHCDQSIPVRVVIVCFRSSNFPLILTRTPEQTSFTDNVDSIALSQRSFRFSYVPCFCWSVSTSSFSGSVLAVSRLGSSVSLVGNGMWYVFATKWCSMQHLPTCGHELLWKQPCQSTYVGQHCQRTLLQEVIAVLSLPLNPRCYTGSSFACETLRV